MYLLLAKLFSEPIKQDKFSIYLKNILEKSQFPEKIISLIYADPTVLINKKYVIKSLLNIGKEYIKLNKIINRYSIIYEDILSKPGSEKKVFPTLAKVDISNNKIIINPIIINEIMKSNLIPKMQKMVICFFYFKVLCLIPEIKNLAKPMAKKFFEIHYDDMASRYNDIEEKLFHQMNK